VEHDRLRHATALIGRGSFLSSALLFILANATYQAGIQFYDSLLLEVTTPENRGRVSGIGTGIGYVGSYIAVALGILLGESHFTEAAHFWPLFVWIAASFLVLSIPCFLFVRERGNPNPRPVFSASAITSSAAETIATFRSGQQYPGSFVFSWAVCSIRMQSTPSSGTWRSTRCTYRAPQASATRPRPGSAT
jgi:UMF1 family MFS transporter